MHGAESFLTDRESLHALDALFRPLEAPHGQYGSGVQPSAGRRIRSLHTRGTLSLSRGRLSQPGRRVQRIPRSRMSLPAGSCVVEADIREVSAGTDIQAQEAADSQI